MRAPANHVKCAMWPKPCIPDQERLISSSANHTSVFYTTLTFDIHIGFDAHTVISNFRLFYAYPVHDEASEDINVQPHLVTYLL